MPEKKTFTSEKIKTDEICGIDGGPVTICGIDSASLGNISGSYISGDNLIVSGHGDSLADFKSGVFDELYISGIKYVPRKQIAYGFRFGGPPISVPSELPEVVGSSDPELYEHLHAGTNLIFVESSDSFATGDHVLVGGLSPQLSSPDDVQETHTITGISYYQPIGCCNSQVAAGTSAGATQVIHKGPGFHDGTNFIVGNKVMIDDHDEVYTVLDSDDYEVTMDTRYISITPGLVDDIYTNTSCICKVQPTLFLESNLQNDYPVGTKVANKFSNRKETVVPSQESQVIGDPYFDKVTFLKEPSSPDLFLGQVTSGYTDELDFGAGDFTVEAIVHGNSFTNWDGIFGVWYDRDDAGKQSFLLYEHPSENGTMIGEVLGLTPDDPFSADGITIADRSKVLISTTAIENEKVYHVALQRKNQTSLELWVNGKLEDQISVDASTVVATPSSKIFRIGHWGADIGTHYDYVKRVRVTKGAGRYVNEFVPNYTSAFPTFQMDENKYRLVDWCEGSTCFDTQHLYLEKAMYDNQTFDWNLTGYRESLISFSGIDFHITGQNTTGLFTMVYPDI
jgi:hypothetical protein